MNHSLYSKFLLGYLMFGLLGFVTIATLSSQLVQQYLIERLSETMYDQATIIADQFSNMYNGVPLDLESTSFQVNSLSRFVQADVWVVDQDGSIIVDSQNSLRENQVIENFNPTAIGNRSYGIGNYYGLYPHDVISVSAPITGNYNTYGYILIHSPVSQLEPEENRILNIVYITGLIIFSLSLIILLVFTKTVYFPLRRITVGANEYAAGNLAYSIKVDTQDEMGYLAATLNYMSSELNKLEEYQKTFIANVSPDFRSPLTSIKGYLEAILDGTNPPQMQEKYLNRVISETERLNKLTQGMLTLNSLDSKGYLSRTNFDINRTIKDTAASFEGTCNAKDISFDLTFSDSIQMVYADLGKIQQVLYNLIDNAIKFSHNGGIIYIQTSLRREKVFISVKDCGIGIPKENLKKIWDRFYKSDISRGKDKKGTGLGLAIVKEIVQSHGENIDVISTQDVGTEFIFSLPRASSSNI